MGYDPELVKKAGQLLKQEHTRRLELEKVAAHNDLEKRAMKVAFREIELGFSEPFRTHEEFLNKVASLMTEDDLQVVEKALQRGYSAGGGGSSVGINSGTLDDSDSNSSGRKLNQMERWVLYGEVDTR